MTRRSPPLKPIRMWAVLDPGGKVWVVERMRRDVRHMAGFRRVRVVVKQVR